MLSQVNYVMYVLLMKKGNIDCSVENMGGMYSGSMSLPNESANNAWTNRNTNVQS